MNIRKKGAAISFTATLLASLIAVIAAPLAFASVSVTSAGNVPRGGTSATAASFTLRENSAACFGVVTPYNPADGGYISIQIYDSANNTTTVHFVPPVGLSAPGSLGASATLQSAVVGSNNDVLTVRMTGHDDLNIEQIVASAKISADSTAATGAIKAKLVAIPPAANPLATNQGPCVVSVPATVTASGRLGNSTTATATSTTSCLAGTSTAGTTATVIQNTGAAYGFNALAGQGISFLTGPAAPQTRTIASNTATSITVTVAFAPAPTAGGGDNYCVGTTSTVLVDNSAAYITNALAGQTLTYTSGPASGQTRTITSNTPTTITVTTPFAPAPGASGDTYTVGTTSYPAGSSVFNVVLDAGSCDFKPTGGSNGNLNFVTNAESRAIATAPPSVTGLQNGITTTTPTGNAHFPGEAVTQTVANCNALTFPFSIGSPGNVANALTQTVEGSPTIVNVGENNQPTADTILSESPAADPGTLTGTVKFTIQTPGILFSASPTANPSGSIDLGAGPGNNVTCPISVDRKSCSVTVVANDASGGDTVELENIKVDVDSTAVPGTPVNIAATAGSTTINTVSATVAFVGRVVVAIAAQPTIYIGFNDQQSGMKTLTESAPGFFQSGISMNNTFGLCLVTGETFTRAPWAVVTAGDLKLLNPTTATATTSQKGTLTNGGKCAYWTVFSGSTVASTIEIRGSADDVTPLPSGALNGPRLSVPSTAAPGSTQDALLIGDSSVVVPGCTTFASCSASPAFAGMLSQAIRAFKNSVTVTASSQPNCPPGTIDCLLGNIVITETQTGQIKAGQPITGWFVPSSTAIRNEVLIKASTTNDLPIISTNASSGLLVSAVTVVCPPALPLVTVCFFTFTVTQQSFGPAFGQITISNIHATIVNGAVPGPILMDWGNTNIIVGVPIGPPPTGQAFESVVSNGNIGSGPPAPALTKTSAASAIGKTQNPAAFSVSTKIVHLTAGNNIVTIRIKVDPALIGKTVTIQRAVKSGGVGGTFGPFTNLTTRTVGADGYAYYYASAHSAQWNSYRGAFLGDAHFAPSRSQTVQVRWL